MVASAIDDPNTSEECENLGSLITHQKDRSEKIWGGVGGARGDARCKKDESCAGRLSNLLSVMNPLPTSREAWLNEIARALRDAAEAIPFGPLVGASFGADELFHLGPVTALKFRGMRRSKRIE